MKRRLRDRAEKERIGLFLMVLAALVLSVMNLLIKAALGELPLMETLFFRSLFGAAFIAALQVARKQPVIGPRPRPLLLLGGLVFAGLCCYYYALGHLALADAVVLNRLSPLFVMVASAVLLGEPFRRIHLAVFAAALVGAGLILKPQLGFAPLAGLAALASAGFSGLAYVMTKQLSADHRSSQIALAIVGVSAAFSLPFLAGGLVLPTARGWLMLAGIGLTSAAGQTLTSKAFALGSPTPVAIASYSVFLFSALWGFLLFGEVQDGLALAGSVLVLACLAALPLTGAAAKVKGEV